MLKDMADNKDAEVPFQPLEVERKTTVAGVKETGGNGVLLSKTKLIILAVVVLILLVLVIVLAVLLVHERASKERAQRYPSGMQRDTNPTSEGPTTPGPEPWWRVRLPDDVIPYHYDLTLYVNLTKPVFKGNTKIWVNVTNSTSYILVHAVNMNFTTVEVKTLLGGIAPIKRHFPFDKNQFHVIELESSLDKGRYTVALHYTGEYADNMRGMYKASFFYPNGTESFYSATQFEPLRARKAFPCFDEPALKATFNVTLAHDPRLISLSNMPLYHSHEKDGWKYDHFGKTVKMSTYLAAFFVGDFTYKELTTIREVNMKIYARADVIDQVDYALWVSNQTMTYFENFFGIPYSLPKSDSVALPAFGPSGMENWGLIKYRETSLLLKEGETSSAAKESIAKLVAHEIAHQWFGNIVTMEWWTDLWLNEGFATYASAFGLDHVHPEWNIIDQFIVRAVQDSLELDGFSNSHAIRIPISDPKRINEIFDAISYKKGASIVLMVQYFLGTPIFRDGLKKYLTDHAFGNAETNDLWDAMTAASHDAGKDINVRETMNTWTGQMGYPVVTLKPSSTPNMYTVTQERFLYYKDPNATKDESSPYGYQWAIPFTYYTATTINKPPSKRVIDKKSDEIPWNGGWVKANVGQTGFYRVNYDEKNWYLLTQQLKLDHKVLNATDRAGLIDDSFNLARANLLNYTTAFEISTYLTKEVDYVPWLSAIRKFHWIMDILPPTRLATKYLKKYVEYVTKAEYDKLGMKDEGTHLDKFKRTILIDANCAAGVQSCKANMAQMYRAWMEDPIKNAVPPDLKALVYHFGIVFGGVEEWDFAYSQFKSTNVVSDINVLLYAMAGAQEPWIIKRYLSYLLDPEKIGPRYARTAVYYITNSNPLGTNEVWSFFQLKWEQISKLFGGDYRTLRYFIPQGTKRFSTEFQLQQVREFMGSKLSGESLPWSVNQAVERVKANVQWRKTHEQVIESWMKEFFAKLQGSGNKFNLGFSDPAK